MDRKRPSTQIMGSIRQGSRPDEERDGNTTLFGVPTKDEAAPLPRDEDPNSITLLGVPLAVRDDVDRVVPRGQNPNVAGNADLRQKAIERGDAHLLKVISGLRKENDDLKKLVQQLSRRLDSAFNERENAKTESLEAIAARDQLLAVQSILEQRILELNAQLVNLTRQVDAVTIQNSNSEVNILRAELANTRATLIERDALDEKKSIRNLVRELLGKIIGLFK
jgi:hypothetical protein